MYLLEAMRGCPWSCRFCLAGHIYNPVRKKDFAVLKAEIGEALSMTRRVGLIGPSLSDYPHAEEILMMEGVDFSITSLRANMKSARIAALMRGIRVFPLPLRQGRKDSGESSIRESARRTYSIPPGTSLTAILRPCGSIS